MAYRIRTLVGGPLDGAQKAWAEGMRLETYVWCPYGGEFDHLAAVLYGPEGEYIRTECRSTDTGEPLVDR